MVMEWSTREGDWLIPVVVRLRFSGHLPLAVRLHREEMERDLQRTRAFFRALTIMLQVPGGSRYIYQETPDRMDAVIAESDAGTVRAIVKACLDRLGCRELIQCVPDCRAGNGCELPVTLAVMVQRRERVGLLNVLAECLDELLVRPVWRELSSEDRVYTGVWEP